MSPARRCCLALLLLPTLVLAAPAQSPAGPYKVLSTVKDPGEGGWDYLTADAPNRRLYFGRGGTNAGLHVYDLDTFASVGVVPTGQTHGAAIDDATHHGFATSNPVTMFDLDTLKVIKTIDTKGRPDGFLDDPVAHRVYVLSHVSPNITALDAATGNILATLDVGAAVEQSVLDNHGHLFVDLEDKDAIAVIDTATLKQTGKYDISSKSGGCAGLAIDAANDILFASCSDKKNMVILSAKDGKILDVLPTGEGSDGAEFNPNTLEAFSTEGEGLLTVIKEVPASGAKPMSFVVEQSLKTQPRARTLTLDLKTGHIITATADFGPAPALQPGQKYARAPMLPNTFRLLVIGK
jgi:DNA-binding beta-propeller fold protein YncE